MAENDVNFTYVKDGVEQSFSEQPEVQSNLSAPEQSQTQPADTRSVLEVVKANNTGAYLQENLNQLKSLQDGRQNGFYDHVVDYFASDRGILGAAFKTVARDRNTEGYREGLADKLAIDYSRRLGMMDNALKVSGAVQNMEQSAESHKMKMALDEQSLARARFENERLNKLEEEKFKAQLAVLQKQLASAKSQEEKDALEMQVKETQLTYNRLLVRGELEKKCQAESAQYLKFFKDRCGYNDMPFVYQNILDNDESVKTFHDFCYLYSCVNSGDEEFARDQCRVLGFDFKKNEDGTVDLITKRDPKGEKTYKNVNGEKLQSFMDSLKKEMEGVASVYTADNSKTIEAQTVSNMWGRYFKVFKQNGVPYGAADFKNSYTKVIQEGLMSGKFTNEDVLRHQLAEVGTKALADGVLDNNEKLQLAPLYAMALKKFNLRAELPSDSNFDVKNPDFDKVLIADNNGIKMNFRDFVEQCSKSDVVREKIETDWDALIRGSKQNPVATDKGKSKGNGGGTGTGNGVVENPGEKTQNEAIRELTSPDKIEPSNVADNLTKWHEAFGYYSGDSFARNGKDMKKEELSKLSYSLRVFQGKYNDLFSDVGTVRKIAALGKRMQTANVFEQDELQKELKGLKEETVCIGYEKLETDPKFRQDFCRDCANLFNMNGLGTDKLIGVWKDSNLYRKCDKFKDGEALTLRGNIFNLLCDQSGKSDTSVYEKIKDKIPHVLIKEDKKVDWKDLDQSVKDVLVAHCKSDKQKASLLGIFNFTQNELAGLGLKDLNESLSKKQEKSEENPPVANVPAETTPPSPSPVPEPETKAKEQEQKLKTDYARKVARSRGYIF